jgi:hypothetical protein
MTPEEIEAMKAENERIKQENQKIKSDLGRMKKAGTGEPAKKTGDPAKTDDDLLTKAKKQTEEHSKASTDTKKIENALRFNLGVSDYVKNNKDLLPDDIEGILKVAEKENYDTANAKANAVKVGMISSFFSVQANVDALTSAQKVQLEDFLKLTKTGKEEKAEYIFENLFEPAIETFKKVRKAEELAKASQGYGGGSSVETAYKERLMKQARTIHLREKGA